MNVLKIIASIFILTSCATSSPVVYSEPPSIEAYESHAATPLKISNPMYPIKAARQGINGWVYFEFDIDDEGRAKNLKVLDAHPGKLFVKNAINSINKWTFEPTNSHVKQRFILEFKVQK